MISRIAKSKTKPQTFGPVKPGPAVLEKKIYFFREAGEAGRASVKGH
jgi:hypothetical protein